MKQIRAGKPSSSKLMNSPEIAENQMFGHRYFDVDGTTWMMGNTGNLVNKGPTDKFIADVKAGKHRAKLLISASKRVRSFKRLIIQELLRARQPDLAMAVSQVVTAKEGPPLKSKTAMRLREDLGELQQFASFTDDNWVHFGNHVKKYGDTRIVFTGALQTLLAHALRKGKALPMTEDYGVRWVPKASYAMKVQYAERYLGWLEDAGIVEKTTMPAKDALKVQHTKRDEAVAKEEPTQPVDVYVAGDTLTGIVQLMARYGAKMSAQGMVRAASGDFVKPEATDRQPQASISFSTNNGEFRVLVGPVNPRWKVRPVELYEIGTDGSEQFIGYVAPAKMKNIPRNRWSEGGKGLQLLGQRGLAPEPADPTPRPLGPAEQQKVRGRIRRKLSVSVALIQFFDSQRRWDEAIEAQYPNGTLFLLRRPDGMWMARYKHAHGTTSSGHYVKGPLAAAKLATQRFIPKAA